MDQSVLYAGYFYEKGSHDTEVLERNVKEYPLSSLAAFLLLYHYRKISHPGFDKLAKKTALLFNNQHWLQLQVHDEIIKNEIENTVAENQFRTGETSEYDSNTFPDEIAEEQNSLPTEIDSLEKEHELNVAPVVSAADEMPPMQIPETLHEQNTTELTSEPVMVNETRGNHPNEPEPQHHFTKQEEPVIAFEPLHTVDYFASQGIKLSDEPITNDKLGSQMKSFTEWLKSMKRLHTSKMVDESFTDEKLIRNAAEVSNVSSDVLTEAMAEILIKQNKREKAIEMFTKLSLINPSKSAYFASRIESIKST
jgi:hypothetical protein